MKIYEEDPYEVCPMIAVHGCTECPLNEQCNRKEKETVSDRPGLQKTRVK